MNYCQHQLLIITAESCYKYTDVLLLILFYYILISLYLTT
jgi:hypothetical protein